FIVNSIIISIAIDIIHLVQGFDFTLFIFGRSKEEIKEFCDFFCCQDEAIYRGFNPKLEVFDKSRCVMLGDSHCSYVIEDHAGE
ncbi:MAG: hypothetical protein AAB299_00245, partial [Thermodesulfobacteriota bacterium]